MRNLVPAILLALAAAGCSKAPGTAKSNPVIGVSVLTTTNPFFVEMADAMKEEAAKHGFEVIVVSGDNDAAKQKAQVEDFLVKKVAAIILCPCNSRAVGTAIAEANAKNVPVFTADIACIDKQAKVVCHVATDNKGGGILAGKAVAEMLGGTGKVAILDYPEVESVMLRTEGFREEMQKHPGIEIVQVLPGGGDKNVSFNATGDLIQAQPKLNGIFAINDPSALGAISKLQAVNKLDKIRIVGFDAHPEGRKAVKAGTLYATITQDQQRIGRTVVEMVAKYLGGDEVPKEFLIPCEIYRKADADKDPSLK